MNLVEEFKILDFVLVMVVVKGVSLNFKLIDFMWFIGLILMNWRK